MKGLLLILLMILMGACQKNDAPVIKAKKDLYRIQENGLFGYIDKLGKVIIKPKFRVAGEFSNGLASARLNGTYGYIDQRGDFVIEPAYDFAYPFKKGLAKVYVDAKPYFIDKEGSVAFDHNFSDIGNFGENDYSIVVTEAENYGLINRRGELLADTIYTKIEEFTDGFAVVNGPKHDTSPDDKEAAPIYEVGVMKPDGNLLVPFGKYTDISEFRNGFARVIWDDEGEKLTGGNGVVDSKGKLKFKIPKDEWHLYFAYPRGFFAEGLATVHMYARKPGVHGEWTRRDLFDYRGVINSEGEMLFSDQSWKSITPFKNGRAFVRDDAWRWYLIDETGQVLNEESFEDILFDQERADELFQNGIQYVQTDKGWGAIDFNGAFVIEPKKIEFDIDDLDRRGDILFTQKVVSSYSDKYPYLYGVWCPMKRTIWEPDFQAIDFDESTDEMICVIQNDRKAYIDLEGNYVWRESKNENQVQSSFNIDYKNRAHFYASSPKVEDFDSYGGWAKSENVFKKISRPEQFQKESVNLIVDSDQSVKYLDAFDGAKLYIANTTKDSLTLSAQDSRIYLIIQALDKDGEWKDIEYTPSSWCGNSYHQVFLPPNCYWEFATPIYEGEFETQLRAKLSDIIIKDQTESETIYSNEFSGGVNPGQFWRKPSNHSSGLMDPYYN